MSGAICYSTFVDSPYSSLITMEDTFLCPMLIPLTFSILLTIFLLYPCLPLSPIRHLHYYHLYCTITLLMALSPIPMSRPYYWPIFLLTSRRSVVSFRDC